MSAYTVRAEGPGDREAVHAVQVAAFGQEAEAALVDRLRRDARPQLSLVAEQAGRVVGHVFVSPVRVGGGSGAREAAGLAPLAVLPEHQGRGAGSALVRAALAACPGVGWRAVFLVGDPGYYARFGFVLAAPLGFRYRSEHFDPVLQVIALAPGALDDLAGEVVYHRAFDALD